MIITCPHCAARYKVRDDLITEKGKRFKCKKCTAVFRANQQGESTLEKAPETAQPQAPEAAPQNQFKVDVGAPTKTVENPAEAEKKTDAPKAPPISAGATVRVDRSQLEDFLKQHQPPAQPDDMPEPPAGFMDEPSKEPESEPAEEGPSAGSTVAIDRSQLGSFLQDQQNAEVDASEEDEAETASTMAMDRSQLDQFLEKQQADANQESADHGYDINQDENESAATMAMDRSQLDEFLKNQQPPTGSGDSEAATMQMDVAAFQEQMGAQTPPAPPVVGDPQEEARVTSQDFETDSKEPDFPSDEELGIDQEKQDLNAEPKQDDEQFSFEDDTLDKQPGPPPLADDPFSTQPEAPAAAASSELFTARVEGTEYPNLNLEAIERWIREGRLLEDDELAPMGSSEFKPATHYPAVARYFEQFHGATQAAVSPQNEKKKGFFAKLFSIFSKKK